MELLTYLFKATVCTTMFYAVYQLFLSKLTFFKFNRFYLLASLILSFVIPAASFTIEREVEIPKVTHAFSIAEDEVPIQTQVLALPKQTNPIPNVVEERPIDWANWFKLIYLIIVVAVFAVSIFKLLRLLKYIDSHKQNFDGLKLISKTAGFTNCSFFNYVFIDDRYLTDQELKVILKHESVHARQLHSIDKLLMMVAKAIMWFNPVIYLYSSSLEQLHEYEADGIASTDFGTADYANLLLRLSLTERSLPLVHNFVKSPIKNRIKMLFNHKSNAMKKFVYLAALPVLLSLIYGFTIHFAVVSLPQEQNEKEFTVVLDAGHGGNKKGAEINGYAEKDLTLSIANKIKAIGKAKGIKIVSTRNADKDVALTDRAKVVGTILLSLHVNSSANAAANGIEMITSGDYGAMDKMKLPKSNSITYYLYKELKTLTGIKVNNKPKHSSVALLNAVAMPGVVLEMGFLSNQNDFNFITNEKRQNELANKIIAAITAYKKYTPSDEVIAARQKEADSVGKAYRVWRQSAKYRSLTSEAAKLSGKTLIGEIESLHHFSVRKILDGLILNSGGKKYRVYIHPTQMEKLDLAQGQRFTAHVQKAEAWFDSEYPVLIVDTQSLPKLGLNKNNQLGGDLDAVLISSSQTTVDNEANVMEIKNPRFKIGDVILEAKHAIWDKNAKTILAENASALKGGNMLLSEEIKVDLASGIFSYSNPKGNVKNENGKKQSFRTAISWNRDLEYSGDSSRLDRVNQILTLFGNSKIALGNIKIDGSYIAYNNIKNITYVKKATMNNGENSFYADSLVFDFNTKKGKFYGENRLKF